MLGSQLAAIEQHIGLTYQDAFKAYLSIFDFYPEHIHLAPSEDR